MHDRRFCIFWQDVNKAPCPRAMQHHAPRVATAKTAIFKNTSLFIFGLKSVLTGLSIFFSGLRVVEK